MLKHGGNLRQAAEEFGIPLDNWLDLSTGINPVGWPVPAISPQFWLHLPQEHDGLEEAARAYYQAPHVLPVAGSQAAIQALPLMRHLGNVGMLSPAYAEHEYNWSRMGHSVIHLSPDEIDKRISELDVLLLVNPNNPTGQRFSVEQLLDWHAQLLEKHGWLIVDEAFMDATPDQSLTAYTDRPGLIVLRSLGKFFGLAGARCGFVLAEFHLLEGLRNLLGPWTVSGPSREIAQQALCDINWQNRMRELLQLASERLSSLLKCYSLETEGDVCLFKWVQHPQAKFIHTTFARQGVWLRYFEHPASLRFGLPDTEQQWQKLESTLQSTIQQLESNNESVAV